MGEGTLDDVSRLTGSTEFSVVGLPSPGWVTPTLSPHPGDSRGPPRREQWQLRAPRLCLPILNTPVGSDLQACHVCSCALLVDSVLIRLLMGSSLRNSQHEKQGSTVCFGGHPPSAQTGPSIHGKAGFRAASLQSATAHCILSLLRELSVLL